MKTAIGSILTKILILMACAVGPVLTQCTTKAVGVTIITHGYDGDTTGWITAMVDQIPIYFQSRYPGLGTNFTIYTVKLTTDGSNYYYQWQRDSGSSPTNTDTGEIIVKLDWSQMAGGLDPYEPYDISTYKVAAVASYVFLQTNTITDLNGHALAEYPIHLIGHSRGGSLISQISLILGTNGVWVDHLTTLDPHPFNNDGNDDIGFPTDAPVRTYQNVTFADNYWQDQGWLLDPDGEQVAGAYVRQLDAEELTEGYNDTVSTSPDHSNVHLWYYGTINLNTPVSYNDDGETVPIDATMRQNWWTPYEDYGYNGGFLYSLIGGGNRTNTDYPEGLPSDPQVVDGYNQNWNLGAGTSENRTTLPSNNGTWPNIIKFDITGTNIVAENNSIITTLYYQYGGSSHLTMQVFLDEDFNPYNSNSIPVLTVQPPASGTGSVCYYSSLALSTTNVPAGTYAIYAKISDGEHTRYLYTPELVQITSMIQPPVLGIQKSGNNLATITISGVSGQKIILQSSANLKTWTPIATNTLTTSSWNYTNSLPTSQQFYRAALSQ